MYFRERKRGRERQKEKQAPCREPFVELHPGSPGSHPRLQGMLNHWGCPVRLFYFKIILSTGIPLKQAHFSLLNLIMQVYSYWKEKLTNSLILSKYSVTRKSLGTTVLPLLYLTDIVFLSSIVQDGVVIISQYLSDLNMDSCKSGAMLEI